MEHKVNNEPRLLDPPLPLEAATVGYVAALVPFLSYRWLTPLRSCSSRPLRQKELEELEEAKERADEMKSLLAVPRALRTPALLRRFKELAARSSDSWASLRRKRKKRRKKKTSSSCGRARRRQRQWHARYAGFPGDVPLRAVFLSVVVRPEMLGIIDAIFCHLSFFDSF